MTRGPDSETIILGVVVLVVVIAAIRFGHAMSSGELLVMAVCVIGPAVVGIFAVRRISSVRDEREAVRWARISREVERTEKIEDLGHTVGGLSAATEAEAGQLSAAQSGEISDAE